MLLANMPGQHPFLLKASAAKIDMGVLVQRWIATRSRSASLKRSGRRCAYVDLASVEIDVRPLERAHLARPQPCKGADRKRDVRGLGQGPVHRGYVLAFLDEGHLLRIVRGLEQLPGFLREHLCRVPGRLLVVHKVGKERRYEPHQEAHGRGGKTGAALVGRLHLRADNLLQEPDVDLIRELVAEIGRQMVPPAIAILVGRADRVLAIRDPLVEQCAERARLLAALLGDANPTRGDVGDLLRSEPFSGILAREAVLEELPPALGPRNIPRRRALASVDAVHSFRSVPSPLRPSTRITYCSQTASRSMGTRQCRFS
jgi:hypothetical protein